MIQKQNIKVGIVTGIVSGLVMFAVAYWLKGGELFVGENHFILQFFVPLWVLALGYCGYEGNRRWALAKSSCNSTEEWRACRRLLLSKLCMTMAKVACLLFIVHFVAWIDGSRYLLSGPLMLGVLAGVGLVLFVSARYLSKCN